MLDYCGRQNGTLFIVQTYIRSFVNELNEIFPQSLKIYFG